MSIFYGNNSTESDEFSTKTSAFFTDQVFKSREELMDWVQTTARSLGYVIITKRSKTNSSGFVYKVILMCDRGGECKVKGTSRASGTKKTNCQFQLEGKYLKEYDFWSLRVICDQHNHPSAQHMEGHPYARQLSDNEFHFVADLTKKNVTPRDILSILKEQNENNVSTLKTIYNARQKIRTTEQVGITPMQVLMSLLHVNGYVFEFTTNDISNELKILFFVHPKSLEIWRAFPHVLIIDAMYKTNIYNMPFVEIVGVTSTSKTFCIAFVFMQKEKEVNYKWALECLKLTLDECMEPRVIVTDRELALMNACREVFPSATRLLCRWHIKQNIMKHCRPSIRSLHDWNSFLSKWELLVESPTWTSYLDNYNQLQLMLSRHPGVLNYLENIWLNKYKEMFVSVWIDQYLNFGNHTTNRVESQLTVLKKHLGSPKSTLDKFVGCIDQIVKSQLTAIKESFERSRITRKHQHNLPCFKLLRRVVSIEDLDIISKEVERSNGLQADFSNCGCKLRKSSGLPCACILLVYLNTGQCIPLDSIDIFWRKLDFSPLTYVQNDDIFCDDELESFRQNFNKQSKSGKRSFLRKLKDIFESSKTSIKEPVVQKNTRGRLNLKKQQQQKRDGTKSRDPHRHSYSSTSNFVGLDIDLNKEPARHSSYLGFQTCYSHTLMTQIPTTFHPYITHIEDVEGDGNYGFRAIAVCLGRSQNQWGYIRQQLIDEIHSGYHIYTQIFNTSFDNVYQSLCFLGSPAPERHWMIMPETGVLIANRFGVMVHSLSIQGDMTCFSLWRGPEEFQQHQTLTIAHVNRNHFVMEQLQGEYPMLTITSFWNFYKYPTAAGWQTMYRSRLELYARLYHRESVFIDLND